MVRKWKKKQPLPLLVFKVEKNRPNLGIQVAQGGCGVSFSGGTQDPPGQGPIGKFLPN